MDEYPIWLAALLLIAMTMQTGGARTGRDVESGRDFVGRDQIIYADQNVWRSDIDQRVRDQRDELMSIRKSQSYQWIAIGAITLLFLFTATIASGLLARQFDLFNQDIQRQFDLIDTKIDRGFDRIERQLEQRIP